MRWIAVLLCGTMGALAHAQTGWQSITFHYQRDTPAERYTISVDSAGNGSYWEGEPDFDVSKVPGGALKMIHLAGALAKLPFGLIGPVGSGNCETHAKNIAQTGRKTMLIEIVNQDVVKCTFNWSDNGDVNVAASAFQAVAETIQMGEQLKHLHRFDRLGLDAEMNSLVEEVKAGRAIEVENIAEVLQSIVDDDRVIQRVRVKAARLLTDSKDAAKDAAKISTEGKSE